VLLPNRQKAKDLRPFETALLAQGANLAGPATLDRELIAPAEDITAFAAGGAGPVQR